MQLQYDKSAQVHYATHRLYVVITFPILSQRNINKDICKS